jgi:hypothetical protein
VTIGETVNNLVGNRRRNGLIAQNRGMTALIAVY